MRVPRRAAPRRIVLALVALAGLAAALPGPTLAATVEDIAALAQSYNMKCTFNKGDVTCTKAAIPRLGLPRWDALIRPAGGEETSLETAATGEMPPGGATVNWMGDMHQAACGDPKGVDAFVTAVGAMTKQGDLGPVVIGNCRIEGGFNGGLITVPIYYVASVVTTPPATPSPSPTPRPSAGATATPVPSTAPTSTASGSTAPVASGSAAPSGSPGPSAAASFAPGESASAAPSLPPSAAPSSGTVVAGETAVPGAAGPPGGAPAAGPPTFEESVLGITEVNTDGGAMGGSLLLALLLLLIVGFAGELFNNTVENNYTEISGWFRKGPLGRLRRVGGTIGGTIRRALGGGARPGLLLFIVLAALISSFVDPYLGLDLRSLAVFLGFLVGLIVVLAAFELPPILAHRRRTGELARLRPLPWALGIALVFVLVSRIGGLQPGYLYGIVLGVLFVKDVSDRDEGRQTFYGALWTLAAAALAWLGLSWVRSLGYQDDAFGATLLSTAFAAILVAGLEAAAFGLMPLRFLPGHSVYKWNRLAWAALFGLSIFAFVHLLVSPASGYVSELSPEAFVAACGVFAAFGALSIAIWGYFRFRPTQTQARTQPEA